MPLTVLLGFERPGNDASPLTASVLIFLVYSVGKSCSHFFPALVVRRLALCLLQGHMTSYRIAPNPNRQKIPQSHFAEIVLVECTMYVVFIHSYHTIRCLLQ